MIMPNSPDKMGMPSKLGLPNKLGLPSKLGSMLGLARKAGKLAWGTERVMDCIRSKRPRLVLAAADISENTRKRLVNCCTFYSGEYGYKIEYMEIELTMDDLSHYVGQSGSVSSVCLEDKGFTDAVKKLLDRSDDGARVAPQEV